MSKGTIFPITQVPKTIPNLFAWLDASDTSTITSSGGLVSNVRNKANTLMDFSQSTGANKPTTGASTINGKNVITFSGSPVRLNNDGLAAYITGTSMPLSSYVVFNNTNSAAESTMCSFGSSSLANPLYIMSNGTSNGIRYLKRIDSGAASSATGTISPINVPAIFSGLYSGTNLNASLNGVSFFNNAFGAGAITLDAFSIGCRTANGVFSAFYVGDIAEIIFYNRLLSAAENTLIIKYLANKWAISA